MLSSILLVFQQQATSGDQAMSSWPPLSPQQIQGDLSVPSVSENLQFHLRCSNLVNILYRVFTEQMN